MLKPEDISQNLAKMAYSIPGIRQGKQTTYFLEQVINRAAFMGGLFLAFLAFFPLLLGNFFQFNLFRNVTSLLILIGVITDVTTKIRGYFLTGIIVTAPVGLTFYVSFLFIGFIDAKVRNIIPVQYHYDNILPFEIPGLGLLFVFIMLTFIGFLTAGLIGRYIIKLGERIIARLPIIRSVYGALKQIFESVLKTSSKS